MLHWPVEHRVPLQTRLIAVSQLWHTCRINVLIQGLKSRKPKLQPPVYEFETKTVFFWAFIPGFLEMVNCDKRLIASFIHVSMHNVYWGGSCEELRPIRLCSQRKLTGNVAWHHARSQHTIPGLSRRWCHKNELAEGTCPCNVLCENQFVFAYALVLPDALLRASFNDTSWQLSISRHSIYFSHRNCLPELRRYKISISTLV